MVEKTDTCPHCGRALVSESNEDVDGLDTRMPCANPDCAGKWTATQFGGDEGVRQSYDVPGLSGGAASD